MGEKPPPGDDALADEQRHALLQRLVVGLRARQHYKQRRESAWRAQESAKRRLGLDSSPFFTHKPEPWWRNAGWWVGDQWVWRHGYKPPPGYEAGPPSPPNPKKPRRRRISAKRRALVARLVRALKWQAEWLDFLSTPTGRQTVASYEYDPRTDPNVDPRAAYGLAPLSPRPSSRTEKPIDRWLTSASVVVAIVLFLVPKTPAVVIACCIAIIGLLVHPVWNFWWIERSRVRRAAALLGVVLTAAAVGKAAWPEPMAVNGSSTHAVPSVVAASAPMKQHDHLVVNTTPATLLTLCDGYTARKCDKLNSAYRGKWVRWTGVVESVGVGDNPTVFLTMPFPHNRILGRTTVIVDFNGSQHDELIRVRQGDKITVLGRIRDSIYMNSVIDLEDSELLSNETVDKEKP